MAHVFWNYYLVIANSLEPMIQFTYDIAGSYNDSKSPVLDVKLWLDHSGEIFF